LTRWLFPLMAAVIDALSVIVGLGNLLRHGILPRP
jgi:hypothetical protein